MKFSVKLFACLLSLVLLVSCGKAEPSMSSETSEKEQKIELEDNTVLVINCGDFDVYERTLVTAFQGIVNRDGPKIYLLTEQTSWINTIDRQQDGSAAYPEGFTDKYTITGTEGVMLDDFTAMYNLKPQTVTLDQAIEAYKDKIAGLIEYDVAVKDESGELIANPARTNAVITAAGVYTCLPVTPVLMKKYESLSNFDTLINMKGKFESKLQATKWAVDTLLDKCSTKFVSSYFNEGENGTFQNDYAVMNSAFCYELAAIVPENMDHVFADASIDKNSYNPTEASLLNQILEHVEDYGFVWGWGAGGENGQASVTALHGIELVCANMPNGSFFAQLKPDRTEWTQPSTVNEDEVTPENKFYIAFMTNEGDSYKAMASLQNHGSWKQNARGTMPINWGTDPLVLDLFPALADYYLSEATENDYFFAAAAGYGYIHPFYLPVDMQDGYAEKVKSGGEKYRLNTIDIWWFTMHDENGTEVQWDWLEKTGMRGLSLWNSADTTQFHNDIPVICSSLYYVDQKISNGTQAYKAGVVAEALKKSRSQMGKKTFCTVIYGGTPEFFANIMKNLPSDDFEAVPIEELFIIAEKSKSTITSVSAKYDIEGSAGAWDPTTQQ